MRGIKRLYRRLSNMTTEAYSVIKTSVVISCVMMLLALVFLIAADTGDNTYFYHLAKELYALPEAVLLAGAIISVCVEERFMK